MGIARTFTKNAAYQLGASLANKLVALFLAVYLANALAPENFGIYAWILAIAILLDVFASFGTGNAIAKFIPDALERGDNRLAAGYFRYLFRVRLLALGAVAIAAIAFAEPIAAFAFGKAVLATPLRIAAAFLVIYNLYGYLQALFISMMKNEHVFASELVSSILRAALIVALVELTGSLYSAVLGYGVSLLIGAAILAGYVLSRYRHVVAGTKGIEKPRVNSYLKFAVLGGASFAVFANVDLLMVSAMLPIDNVGFYRVALAWSSVAIGLLPLYIMFPVMSSLAAKPPEHLREGFSLFFKYLNALTIPLSLLAAYIAAPLVGFFYTAEYAIAAPLLEVLAMLIALNSLAILLMILFNAVERIDIYTKAYALAIVLSIALNYALISAFGVIGAAYATVLAYLAICAVLVYFVKRALGFGVNAVYVAKPLFASLVMFALLMYVLPAPQDLVIAIVFALCGAAVYIALQLGIKGITIGEVLHLRDRILNP